MKVKTMTAALRTTMRESPGLKQLEFWRRTISSMRGCCHLPGVDIAGEALYARDRENGPFCGVRDAIGCTMAFFAFVAGDCNCDWELVERDKLLVEVDWTRSSEVDDMFSKSSCIFPSVLAVVYGVLMTVLLAVGVSEVSIGGGSGEGSAHDRRVVIVKLRAWAVANESVSRLLCEVSADHRPTRDCPAAC